MISCLTLSCRRRRVLRAALATLVAFTGCQGSLRSWRRDDPNVRDLVVTPHPLDERSDTRDAYAQRNRRANQSGRANPYAASATERNRSAPSDDVAEAYGEEDPNFEIDDAALRTIIGNVDPRHRAMLVLQYQAMKNGRHALEEAEYAEGVEDSEELTDNMPSSKNMPSERSTDEVQTAAYSRSDRGTQVRDTQVRQASATQPIETDKLGNPISDKSNNKHSTKRNSSQREEAVQYSISDLSEDTETPTSYNGKASPARPGSKPHEMKPPKKTRAENRTVNEPVADTGYEEQISTMRRTGGPREGSTTSSSRRTSSAPTSDDDPAAVDSHYTDQSYVTTASAESSLAGNDEPVIRNVTRKERFDAPSGSSDRRAENSEGTNDSGHAPRTDDWREQLQTALRALEQEQLDSSPTAQLNHHVTKRTLFVLLGQLNQALEPIPGLQPHEQEYFRHNFQALYNSIDVRGNPVLARRWPLVMDNHRTAMSHLGAVSNLEVKNAAFCSNVDGFGSITKFPSNQFKPNQELLLYCEVENFVSEQIKDGYETRLRGNYEIVDANQTRVADFILPEEADICKRPRRDYFFVYRIYTPQQIAPGRYQLRLTIEDMKGNKFGQTSLDMQIVAQ